MRCRRINSPPQRPAESQGKAWRRTPTSPRQRRVPVKRQRDKTDPLRIPWRTTFLSPISTKNKSVADAVCATLEKAAIRCWIAPRDVRPGRPFAGEITRAINRSKAMVLIFSADSNNSPQILRELQLAADARLHIIPFRIEDLAPNEDLAYYLAGPRLV